MKIKVIVAAVLLASIGTYAGEPYELKNCGFSTSNAVGKGFLRYVFGQTLDCVLWGCIPVLGAIGAGSAVVEEVDIDCAGYIVGQREGNEWRYQIGWDRESLNEAVSDAKAFCKKRACDTFYFRHAGAAYQPRTGDRAYFGQAADIPTAKEIAHGRCYRATGRQCILVFARRNRN